MCRFWVLDFLMVRLQLRAKLSPFFDSETTISLTASSAPFFKNLPTPDPVLSLELTDGEQVLFVESSSSPMLDAAGSRPASHLAQVRAAERASVACVSSGGTPTTAMEALK